MAKRRNRRKDSFLIGRKRNPLVGLMGKESLPPCDYECSDGTIFHADHTWGMGVSAMYSEETINAYQEKFKHLTIYRLQPMKLVDGKLVPDEGE